MSQKEASKLWVGNLSQEVSEELLYELFLQAGPIESVKLPKDRDGHQRSFAFIQFKHECTVPYALRLFEGTELFGCKLNMNTRYSNHEELKPIFPPNPEEHQNFYPMVMEKIFRDMMPPMPTLHQNMNFENFQVTNDLNSILTNRGSRNNSDTLDNYYHNERYARPEHYDRREYNHRREPYYRHQSRSHQDNYQKPEYSRRRDERRPR